MTETPRAMPSRAIKVELALEPQNYRSWGSCRHEAIAHESFYVTVPRKTVRVRSPKILGGPNLYPSMSRKVEHGVKDHSIALKFNVVCHVGLTLD